MKVIIGAAIAVGCLRHGAGVCDEQFTGSSLLVELKARSLDSSRDDENFLTLPFGSDEGSLCLLNRFNERSTIFGEVLLVSQDDYRGGTEQASKTSVLRDASDNFTEKTSKRIVSRDASDNFHRKNFQKDRKLKMEKNSPKKLN